MNQEKCGICGSMVDCPEGDIFSHWRERHPTKLNDAVKIARKILDEQCRKIAIDIKITQTPS